MNVSANNMHSTDKEDYFRVRFDNDVAIITMCRDENRINGTFVEKINSVLDNILEWDALFIKQTN